MSGKRFLRGLIEQDSKDNVDARIQRIEEHLANDEKYLQSTTAPSSTTIKVGAVVGFVFSRLIVLMIGPPSIIWLLCFDKQKRSHSFDDRKSGQFESSGKLAAPYVRLLMSGICSLVLNIIAIAGLLYWYNVNPAVSAAMVAWALTVAALTIYQVHVARLAGNDAEEADSAFTAEVLVAFGIKSENVGGEQAIIFFLVGMLPALVALFVVKFLTKATEYSFECSPAFTHATAGVEHCSHLPSGHPINGYGLDVCCKLVEDTFDVSKFFAFLAGNVLAGYHGVKFLAGAHILYLVDKGVAQVVGTGSSYRNLDDVGA